MLEQVEKLRKGPSMKEAMLYEKLPDRKVVCHLCYHQCRIEEGNRGLCRVRENQEGTLYSLVYRQLISRNVDLIERITTWAIGTN